MSLKHAVIILALIGHGALAQKPVKTNPDVKDQKSTVPTKCTDDKGKIVPCETATPVIPQALIKDYFKKQSFLLQMTLQLQQTVQFKMLDAAKTNLDEAMNEINKVCGDKFTVQIQGQDADPTCIALPKPAPPPTPPVTPTPEASKK